MVPVQSHIQICRKTERDRRRNSSPNPDHFTVTNFPPITPPPRPLPPASKKSGPRVTSDPSLRSLNSSQDEGHYVSDSDTDVGDGSTLRTKWSYDKMAAVPAVAEAFRTFAWRALCQESVMFLEEVSK